jgi:hypothetical protein
MRGGVGERGCGRVVVVVRAAGGVGARGLGGLRPYFHEAYRHVRKLRGGGCVCGRG